MATVDRFIIEHSRTNTLTHMVYIRIYVSVCVCDDLACVNMAMMYITSYTQVLNDLAHVHGVFPRKAAAVHFPRINTHTHTTKSICMPVSMQVYIHTCNIIHTNIISGFVQALLAALQVLMTEHTYTHNVYVHFRSVNIYIYIYTHTHIHTIQT